MLTNPKDRKPPQTLCNCIVPAPFQVKDRVFCRKCGYLINPEITRVIITGNDVEGEQ